MDNNSARRDDIDKYYKLPKYLDKIRNIIFWSYIVLTFVLLYSDKLLGNLLSDILRAIFLVLIVSYFVISQLLNLNLFPKAAAKRRDYLFSNSFGTLTIDESPSYFDNEFTPSIERLGANTLENVFFTQKIASIMLKRRVPIVIIYVVIWFTFAIIRQSSLELIVIITQVVFSGEIVASLLKLNLLRASCEQVYQNLFKHFDYLRRNPERNSNESNATILSALVEYEVAKSYASTSLSTKEFEKINKHLSKEWKKIKNKLQLKD